MFLEEHFSLVAKVGPAKQVRPTLSNHDSSGFSVFIIGFV